MGHRDCLYRAVFRREKEIVMVVALCVFMAFLCLLFIAIGIVWLLADCTVRKLEKGGCVWEKGGKRIIRLENCF